MLDCEEPPGPVASSHLVVYRVRYVVKTIYVYLKRTYFLISLVVGRACPLVCTQNYEFDSPF